MRNTSFKKIKPGEIFIIDCATNYPKVRTKPGFYDIMTKKYHDIRMIDRLIEVIGHDQLALIMGVSDDEVNEILKSVEV